MVNFCPADGYVWAEPVIECTKTDSGIIIGTKEELPSSAKVIINKIPSLVVKSGDIIYFGKYKGIDLKLPDDSTKYVILKEDEVFGYSKVAEK